MKTDGLILAEATELPKATFSSSDRGLAMHEY